MNELIAEILHLQELYSSTYNRKLISAYSKSELSNKSSLTLAKIYHELANLL